jgi:regulator of cell morphogenesis and NO signaling
MPITANQTVKEAASTSLAVLRILEDHRLDFCKDASRTLETACAENNIPIEELLAELNQQGVGAQREPADWNNEPLCLLAAHIVRTHHQYLRRELPRLAGWMERVVANHGPRRPEMFGVLEGSFRVLRNELLPHLDREEAVLFPAIARCEAAVVAGAPIPLFPFGRLANPVAVMERDHDGALRMLAAMREATNGYEFSADACTGYKSLFRGLREMEEDLRRHIALENEILFRRARELESSPVGA